MDRRSLVHVGAVDDIDCDGCGHKMIRDRTTRIIAAVLMSEATLTQAMYQVSA